MKHSSTEKAKKQKRWIPPKAKTTALLITWHFREHHWNGLSNSGIWRSKQTQRYVITNLISSSAWLEDEEGETRGRELLLIPNQQTEGSSNLYLYTAFRAFKVWFRYLGSLMSGWTLQKAA